MTTMQTEPYDPETPKGRAVAAELTRVLADLEEGLLVKAAAADTGATVTREQDAA